MVALLSLFIACAPQPASIKFDAESVTVNALDAAPVAKATVLDAEGNALAEQPALTWTVDPATVATLDGMNVKPVASGEATVTAAVGEVKGSYKFVVALADKVEIAGYTAGSAWPVGGTVTLTPTVKAGETVLANQTVTWSSSDENVASVDASGVVTGKADGKATITAKLNDTVSSAVEIAVGTAVVATADAAAPAAGQ
jgi:uncharacterized protein YjdB